MSFEHSTEEGTVSQDNPHMLESTKRGQNVASDEVPDGGLLAWTQIAASFFIFFNTWGLVYTFGSYQRYYEAGILSTSSTSNISWIGSVQGSLLLLLGLFTGPLYDLGYLNTLVNLGTVLTVLGMMLTSLCRNYAEVLVAQGFLVGIGNGLLFLPSVAIVPQYFSKRKCLATGIAAAAAVLVCPHKERLGRASKHLANALLGAVVYPIVFAQVQPMLGFPWATRILGFIILATSAITVASIKPRNKIAAKRRRVIDLMSLREPSYGFFCLGLLFGFMGLYIVFFYIELFALQVGHMSEELAAYALVIVNASSAFGRVLPNHIADKLGPLNVHIPFTFIVGLLAFCWQAVQGPAGLLVFGVFYGFFSGTFVSLIGPIVVGLSVSTPHLIGTRLGMAMSFAGIGLLVGNPIAGAILKSSGWVGLQNWAGSLVVASGLCVFCAKGLRFGWTLKARA